MSDHVVNVAFISDDNYVAHLAVSIGSMLEQIGCNHRSSEESCVNIYILDAGIAPKSRELLLRSITENASQCRLSWSIIFIQVSVPESLNISGGALRYLNRAIFAKLYLVELLPPEIKKIIFLDSDLLVLRDVMDLWFTDIQGKVMAATSDNLPFDIRLVYPPDVPWQQNWKIANTGVMILDIDQLRRREAHEDLIGIATKHSLPFLEQDVWNLYCQGDWFELDDRWNVNLMGRTDFSTGGDRRSREVLENPFIVHFCSKPKPWDCRLRLSWAEEYYQRLANTPWAGLFPKSGSPEKIEAEMCVFVLKVWCRSAESSRRRGEKERAFLPRLQRALMDSTGKDITNLADLRLTVPPAEFTAALDIIEQRIALRRKIYDKFDLKLYLQEICQEISCISRAPA
jgi:lipopolysaccharide biosynthesis glycosyltransferase